MSILADRYATGALAAAKTQEAGEALLADLERFAEAVVQTPKLTAALVHPALRTQRAQIVEAVSAALQLQPISHRVLALLVQRDRVGLLQAIVVSLRAQTDARAGRLRAHIVSAMPVSDQQLSKLLSQLSARLGQPVLGDVSVDSTLIGGMVCEVGSLTFDNSLKNQLGMMADQLGAHAHQ